MKTKRLRFNTYDLILCAFFIALITVGAYIRIPLTVVPVTLQLLFVMLAGQVLSPLAAGLTVFTYICLGVLGLPVFASGGGVGYLLTPTFGYLLGFLVAAVVIGALVSSKDTLKYKRLLLANLLGFALVYVFGIGYYVLLNMFYFNTYLDIGAFLLTGFVIFIPSDMAFCFIAALVGKRIRPVLLRFSR